jgi:hypothetical protein
VPTSFEVVATNCELAQQILDAGNEVFKANLANDSELVYTCIEKASRSLTAWQVFLAIYIVLLIPTFVGWVVLYRKGAPSDQLLALGVLSMLLPVFAPLVALMGFGNNVEAAEKLATAEVAMEAGPGLLFERKQNADDQN